MALPVWPVAAGGEQRQARPLPVGLVEQLGQQPLGLGQGLMAAGRSRRIDDHQPQRRPVGLALLPA